MDWLTYDGAGRATENGDTCLMVNPERRDEGESRSDGSPPARSRRILADLFGPPAERRFAVRYWNGDVDRPAGEPAFVLSLTWPGALRRMLIPPTNLSLGAAYVRGDYDVEGDLETAFRTVRPVFESFRTPVGVIRLMRIMRAARRLPAEPRLGSGASESEGRSAASRSLARRHTRSRDAHSVRYHYDITPDFFRLWLDPWMQYSSGCFPRGTESLADGQEAKLELICRKLALEPGHRLLDIGCGWGGLVHFAAERYGVEGVGITLSSRQAEVARRRLDDAGLSDRCRIQVLDYRDLNVDLRFDRIVSIGMVEHVGARRMPEYFSTVHRHLAPEGLFLNQGIVTLEDTAPWRRQLRQRLVAPWAGFMERYVFPDGELLTSAERIGPAERAGFELRGVESLREDYAVTLRHWTRRLESHHAEAVSLAGERAFRVWRLYMAASAYLFQSGDIGVTQELYRKPAER